METIDLIIKTLFFFVNSCCVCAICLFVVKWHRLIEDKLDEALERRRTITIDRIDVTDEEIFVKINSSVTMFRINDLKKLIKLLKDNNDKEDKQ